MLNTIMASALNLGTDDGLLERRSAPERAERSGGGGMRCGLIPITSPTWQLRSTRPRRTEQQLTAELSSGVAHHFAQPESGGLGAECAAAQPDSTGRFVHAKLESGDGPVAGGRFGLGSVVSQLTQAISLATSANNGTMNASDVKSIGNQISGILNEVQSLANTSYQGQYIFAGGQTSTSSIYDLDSHIAGRYHATTATRTSTILRRRTGRRFS